jgi:hypothetical protein
MDGWMDEWMVGWMNGWMDGWMDGLIDGWMDIPRFQNSNFLKKFFKISKIQNLKISTSSIFPHCNVLSQKNLKVPIFQLFNFAKCLNVQSLMSECLNVSDSNIS